VGYITRIPSRGGLLVPPYPLSNLGRVWVFSGPPTHPPNPPPTKRENLHQNHTKNQQRKRQPEWQQLKSACHYFMVWGFGWGKLVLGKYQCVVWWLKLVAKLPAWPPWRPPHAMLCENEVICVLLGFDLLGLCTLFVLVVLP